MCTGYIRHQFMTIYKWRVAKRNVTFLSSHVLRVKFEIIAQFSNLEIKYNTAKTQY